MNGYGDRCPNYLWNAVASACTRSIALHSVSRVRTSQLLQLLRVCVPLLRLLLRRHCLNEVDAPSLSPHDEHYSSPPPLKTRLFTGLHEHCAISTIMRKVWMSISKSKRSDLGDWASDAHFTSPSPSNRSPHSEELE